jgi:hypothetical protein
MLIMLDHVARQHTDTYIESNCKELTKDIKKKLEKLDIEFI